MLDGKTMASVWKPKGTAQVIELIADDSENDSGDVSPCSRPPSPCSRPTSPCSRPPHEPAARAWSDGPPGAPTIKVNVGGVVTGGMTINVNTTMNISVAGQTTATSATWKSGTQGGNLSTSDTNVFSPNQPGSISGGAQFKTAFGEMKNAFKKKVGVVKPKKMRHYTKGAAEMVDCDRCGRSVGATGGSLAMHQKGDRCRRDAESGVYTAGVRPVMGEAAKRQRGSAHRNRYSWRRKNRVIQETLRRSSLGLDGYGSSIAEEVAADFGVPAPTARKWMKEPLRSRIEKNAADPKEREKEREGVSTYKYPEVDRCVQARFDKLRKDGRALTPRWLVWEYRSVFAAQHPEAAATWKASPRWRTAYYKRNHICLRKKDNNHLRTFIGLDGREMVLKRYFAVTMRRIASGCTANAPPNSAGRWPQGKRMNVDAVPVEWACGAGKTLEDKGSTRVIIYTGKGDADGKRWCTLNVAIRNLKGHKIGQKIGDTEQGHPPPCINFRGVEGNAYYEDEYPPITSTIDNPSLDHYHPGVIVQFQRKAWYDDASCVGYVGKMSAYLHAVNESPGRTLMFMDNLRGQTTDQFVAALNRVGVDPHYLPANMTDDVQPVDKSIGKAIKDRIGELRHVWEQGFTNNEELAAVTAGQRRVRLTHFYWEAYEQVLKTGMIPRMFDYCGATLTNTGIREGTQLSIQSVKKHTQDMKKLNIDYKFSFCAADAGPPISGDNGRRQTVAIPATLAGQAAMARFVAAEDEQATEVIAVTSADERLVSASFDEIDGGASSDDDDPSMELGPMPAELQKSWKPMPKGAITARDSLVTGQMVACNWDAGWEVGYIKECPRSPYAPDKLFYIKFPGDNNFWPVYMLDEQYGTTAEHLWTRVEDASDGLMAKHASKAWKNSHAKTKRSKGKGKKKR